MASLTEAAKTGDKRATLIAWIIGSFWIINGWVQGMGFPPCAKSLMHWFAPHEHGIKFATWNISHNFGAGCLFILNAFRRAWLEVLLPRSRRAEPSGRDLPFLGASRFS